LNKIILKREKNFEIESLNQRRDIKIDGYKVSLHKKFSKEQTMHAQTKSPQNQNWVPKNT